MKPLRVLVVFDCPTPPPEDQDFSKEFEQEDWFTEAAVVETLRAMGHQVDTLGLHHDIRLLIDRVEADRPDIVFNLTELFMGKAHYDKHIPAVLEVLNVPYTGCGPGALMLCNNKALTKTILTYHRIKVPGFYTFRRGKRIWMPKRLQFPLFIKPLREEASTGISQASVVNSDDQLRERVTFVHEKMNMHAIAEEYIQGREFYVSLLGGRRIWAFPVREMTFSNVPDGEPCIATYKAKWDEAYRKKWGITNGFARDLDPALEKKILAACKRAYRALGLYGYARFDCRLTPENLLYIIEANANPELAQGDEFAESAEKGGFPFPRLLSKMIALGLERD